MARRLIELGHVQVLGPAGRPMDQAIQVSYVERLTEDTRPDTLQLNSRGYFMGRVDLEKLDRLIELLEQGRERLRSAGEDRVRLARTLAADAAAADAEAAEDTGS